MKDIAVAFGIPNISDTLTRKDTQYQLNVHYTIIFCNKPDNIFSAPTKRLFLTYKGLLRVLFAAIQVLQINLWTGLPKHYSPYKWEAIDKKKPWYSTSSRSQKTTHPQRRCAIPPGRAQRGTHCLISLAVDWVPYQPKWLRRLSLYSRLRYWPNRRCPLLLPLRKLYGWPIKGWLTRSQRDGPRNQSKKWLLNDKIASAPHQWNSMTVRCIVDMEMVSLMNRAMKLITLRSFRSTTRLRHMIRTKMF